MVDCKSISILCVLLFQYNYNIYIYIYIYNHMHAAGASVIITANEAVIGIKTHSLKINVNKAIESCENSEQQKHIGYTVLVANRTPSESKDLAMVPGRDFWLEKV